MSGPIRTVTIALVVVYAAAVAYHSGLLVPSGTLTAAAIAEGLLGLVLVALLVGLIRSALAAYAIVLAGTLFGLSIVIARGLFGLDLAIHIVMLVGPGIGLALIRRERGAAPSA